MDTLSRMLHGDEGQGLVEFALIIALVSLATVVIFMALSNNLNSTVSNAVNNGFGSASGSGGGGPLH